MAHKDGMRPMVVQRAVTPQLAREHGEFDSHPVHMRVSPSGKASGFHPDTRGFDPRHPLIEDGGALGSGATGSAAASEADG